MLPLLMLFVLGIVDLGMWDYQTSQTSSAARDGARYASVDVIGTDKCLAPCTSPTATPSADNLEVKSAIAARLHGPAFTFTVRCLPKTGTTYKPCTADMSTVDRDRVEVSVVWTRPAMTFVSRALGASQTVKSTSTMTISG